MNIPNGLTLVVENRQNKTRPLGNTVLDPNEKDSIHFSKVDELRLALSLAKKHEIRFHTAIPEDVMALLELPIPPTEVAHPDAPSGLFYRDEFIRFNQEIETKLKENIDGGMF